MLRVVLKLIFPVFMWLKTEPKVRDQFDRHPLQLKSINFMITYCTSGPLKFPSNYVLCQEISDKYWSGIFFGISLPKYWSVVAKMADHKQKQQNVDCLWQTVRRSLN